jgi:pheromone shutdown-related protein TraB
MERLKIIGTSHISKQSINEIKNEIKENKPDIVALELDLQRAASLMEKQKRKIGLREILQIGIKGYLFAKIGQVVQEKLGKIVGVSPGSEMKTALELARKEKLKVALIDQPIKITLKKFSKSLTWKEKLRFVGDIFRGIFFRKRQMHELGLDKLDLSKVPSEEVIKKMMSSTKKRYPNIYKTLVSDRNRYMVKKLVKLMRDNPGKNVLTVVGAGHKEGMEKLLLKVDIVN